MRSGLKEVPALVKVVPDASALAIGLIENIQREDLNPLEQANGLARLIDEFGLTHDAVAKAIGRSRSAVTNLLRLRELAKPVQEFLLAGKLDMGHARALLGLAAGAQRSTAAAVPWTARSWSRTMPGSTWPCTRPSPTAVPSGRSGTTRISLPSRGSERCSGTERPVRD